ncbi:hypothetical protein GCM10009736_13920 [Actinomadura bangladeshensis]
MHSHQETFPSYALFSLIQLPHRCVMFPLRRKRTGAFRRSSGARAEPAEWGSQFRPRRLCTSPRPHRTPLPLRHKRTAESVARIGPRIGRASRCASRRGPNRRARTAGRFRKHGVTGRPAKRTPADGSETPRAGRPETRRRLDDAYNTGGDGS